MGPFLVGDAGRDVCVCDMNAGLCPQPRLWLSGWDLKSAQNVVGFQREFLALIVARLLGWINCRGVGRLFRGMKTFISLAKYEMNWWSNFGSLSQWKWHMCSFLKMYFSAWTCNAAEFSGRSNVNKCTFHVPPVTAEQGSCVSHTCAQAAVCHILHVSLGEEYQCGGLASDSDLLSSLSHCFCEFYVLAF